MLRLREALGVGEDNKALMAALKMKRSAFYNRIGSGSVPLEEVVALAKERGISCDWLLFGVGTTDLAGKKEPSARAGIDIDELAQIYVALERALKEVGVEETKLSATVAIMLVGGIYNEVSLVKPGAGRRSAITTAATTTAHALKISDLVTAATKTRGARRE